MSFPVPFAEPTATTGKIILLAQATAAPGRADELQKLIAAIRTRADSSAEPHTLTYRTNRGAEPGQEDKFVIYEEYVLPSGIKEHMSAEFKALGDSGAVAALDIQYFHEFQ